MSQTITDPLTPLATLKGLLDSVPSDASDYSLTAFGDILAALGAPASGTAKAWLEARHGAIVDTVQVNIHDGSAWAPSGRTIDSASRSSATIFDGSTRDYAGLRVLAATDTCLIATNDWHVIAYTSANFKEDN
jgi:hypothetical protein